LIFFEKYFQNKNWFQLFEKVKTLSKKMLLFKNFDLVLLGFFHAFRVKLSFPTDVHSRWAHDGRMLFWVFFSRFIKQKFQKKYPPIASWLGGAVGFIVSRDIAFPVQPDGNVRLRFFFFVIGIKKQNRAPKTLGNSVPLARRLTKNDTPSRGKKLGRTWIFFWIPLDFFLGPFGFFFGHFEKTSRPVCSQIECNLQKLCPFGNFFEARFSFFCGPVFFFY